MAAVTYERKTRQLLVCAAAEARALGHSYVGSEHLLLGLLTQTDTLAGRILRSAGLQAENLRLMTAALWGRGAPGLAASGADAPSPENSAPGGGRGAPCG